MEQFELIVPTLFGLESFVAKEIRWLGYETTSVEDGKVTFLGDFNAIARVNMWLRTGERVLIKVARFKATTFEELFEGTKAADWSRWIGSDAAFPVKGHSLKSQLASVRDCQAIIKKAVATSLGDKYGMTWFEEDGPLYQIQFSLMKDVVTLMIDTSGDGLHKRGYRKQGNVAPLRETIAAAMVMMSYWKFELPFADPFCGSGTIPIEAAMFKQNIAPGINRKFAYENFVQIDKSLTENSRTEAEDKKRILPLEIYASDIDQSCVELAKSNATLAGVADVMNFKCQNAIDFMSDNPYGTLICNPPYGERISDVKSCEQLYRDMGKSFANLDKWAYYILTSHEKFENLFGKKSDKKRKMYNGMIKCNIYQYFAPKPPKDILK